MYPQLAKRAECSPSWCKMLYRQIKLYIVIQISKQLSEKCVQQAKIVCSSIFSLFLSRILAALFSSLSKEIYLHGSCDVKFYIATFQNKICFIDLLRKISEIIENMIFSLISFYGKYDISVNSGKSRKYDIYVERFYENIVFHAVVLIKSFIKSFFKTQMNL